MAKYDKVFLPLAEQVEHLEAKGLSCDPKAEALEALHEYGYYRLGAYTYPFRRLLKPEEDRETPFQFRADNFVSGSKLADAVALARFDHGLRDKVFDGIAAVELALRFQIAHVLGKRNKFGHVDKNSLDRKACSELPPKRYRESYLDMFEYWCSEYDTLVARAASEDFIKHVQAKYDDEIPIWIAVEVFDFGGLVRLYSLLERYDQNLIAGRFGVSDGRMFHKWLTGLNIVRNHCAHHNRLWNRQLPAALGAVPPLAVSADLHHLSEVEARKKVYVWMALLAYMLRNYDNSSNWFRTFATQMTKFPSAVHTVTVEADMGFPSGWRQQPLWNGSPTTPRILPTPVD